MKKELLVFVLIFTVLVPQTFAQKKGKVDTGIHFGILAGGNMQNFYGKNSSGEKLAYKLTPGFHAGVKAEIQFSPDLFFQPELLYTSVGAKQEILEDVTRIYSLSYLEMPLNLLYRPQLGDGHLLLGFGPYVAYGIKGKRNDGQYGTLPVKFLNKADLTQQDFVYYRPFDGGVNIFFGYEMYNGIFCQLNAQLGLLKINSYYIEDKASIKNIGFGLSVGYRF